MHKSLARVALITAFLAILAGCNTIKGVGKDIQAAGDKIEKTAEKHD